MDGFGVHKLFSPAKVNIGLSIVGRRPNGYHELQSLFWPLNFGDEIEISLDRTSTVKAEWDLSSTNIASVLPQGEENIVGRIFKKYPFKNKYKILLRKNIPLGAGLGGGSSNAGTVLKYLIDQNEIPFSVAEELALSLGADVPFFLSSKPSWVTGIGEKVTPLTIEKPWNLYFLLVLIPEHSSTQAVFDEYKKRGTAFSAGHKDPFTEIPDFKDFMSWLKAAKNDLESLVTQSSRITRETITALHHNRPLYAGLSGSGSACFGIYANHEDREKAIKVLLPLCRKNNCRSITAETYSGEQLWKSPKLKSFLSTKIN
jgi:4-diphosphocytidyl-2-C-methyl-D-erythritol kinase